MEREYILILQLIDRLGNSEITDTRRLASAISYSSKLWNDSELEDAVEDGVWCLKSAQEGIALYIQEIDIHKLIGDRILSGFHVSVHCSDKSKLEQFRPQLIQHCTENLKFDKVQVLKDTASLENRLSIARAVSEVEHDLQHFVLWFITNTLKTNWESVLFPDQLTHPHFPTFEVAAQWINQQIHFALNDPKTLLTKIFELNTQAELSIFRQEAHFHYFQFFQQNFAQVHFAQLADQTSRLQRQLQEYHSFEAKDVDFAAQVCTTLKKLLSNAVVAAEAMIIGHEELHSIRKVLNESTATEKTESHQTPYLEDTRTVLPGPKIVGQIDLEEVNNKRKPQRQETFRQEFRPSQFGNFNPREQQWRDRPLTLKSLTREEALLELEHCIKERPDEYIGLKWFVTYHLWNLEYQVAASYSMINFLISTGEIELYEIETPTYPVKAIRLRSDL